MARTTKKALNYPATKEFLGRVDKLLPLYGEAYAALNTGIDALEAAWPKSLDASDFIISPRHRKDHKRARNLASCLLVWLPMPDMSEAKCERLLDSIEHVGEWLSGVLDPKPKKKAKVVKRTGGARKIPAKPKRP